MSENSAEESGRTVTARPRTVTVAALLCGLQGVALAALGAVMLVLAATGEPDDMTQAVTGAVTVLALAVLPLAAGHGLWRLRRWSRGPAVLTQLLAIPVTWTLLGSGGLWPVAAVGLGASALAALGCLMNPTATRALGVGPRQAA
ncbi:hypothetical protein [Streptomyces litchfieldiae]|uniref:Integral membrane protein n=1 Tax=Streptomyces litchfieldiae TaxID=3075543 RepID=A0ABU2MJ82_9ACTN|nr:hypothetical protein [Streptomyces sp. DSM 44938]MDT0341658.1 hypothetical protein [Streptomyces sp. DSM 44938]